MRWPRRTSTVLTPCSRTCAIAVRWRTAMPGMDSGRSCATPMWRAQLPTSGPTPPPSRTSCPNWRSRGAAHRCIWIRRSTRLIGAPYHLSLLTREAVERLREPIRRFAVELLTPLLSRDLCDICEDFSSRLPVAVFAEWMNMPAELVDTLRETARAYVYAVQRFNGEMVKATSFRLYDMARTLIAQRRHQPLDPACDITSALLAVTEGGQPLPDDMIVGAVRQILVVGIVAPNVMIGSICVHLSRFPELQAQLRRNPELVPNAIEEYLRLYTPYRGFARTPTRDITLHGALIRQGEPIALNYASANRDDSVFPNADQFILDRPNIKDHLAFGRGPHNCPGHGWPGWN